MGTFLTSFDSQKNVNSLLVSLEQLWGQIQNGLESWRRGYAIANLFRNRSSKLRRGTISAQLLDERRNFLQQQIGPI